MGLGKYFFNPNDSTEHLLNNSFSMKMDGESLPHQHSSNIKEPSAIRVKS